MRQRYQNQEQFGKATKPDFNHITYKTKEDKPSNVFLKNGWVRRIKFDFESKHSDIAWTCKSQTISTWHMTVDHNKWNLNLLIRQHHQPSMIHNSYLVTIFWTSALTWGRTTEFGPVTLTPWLSWVEQRLTSHQTHYRSSGTSFFRGQMTQPTVSQHWKKIGPKNQASIPSGPSHHADNNRTHMHIR